MAATGHLHNEQRAAASTGPGLCNNDSSIDSSMGHVKLNGKQIVDENEVLSELNGVGAIASKPQEATAREPKIPEAAGRDFGPKFKGKQTFASLFKDDRVPSEESKLHFFDPPPLGELGIAIENMDSVQKSFGFCLVRYVMGSRPSLYTVKNFIKGWGQNIKFTFKDNGWIRFQFPSEIIRDIVLNGRSYMK